VASNLVLEDGVEVPVPEVVDEEAEGCFGKIPGNKSIFERLLLRQIGEFSGKIMNTFTIGRETDILIAYGTNDDYVSIMCISGRRVMLIWSVTHLLKKPIIIGCS
jgi:hypothetical protein